MTRRSLNLQVHREKQSKSDNLHTNFSNGRNVNILSRVLSWSIRLQITGFSQWLRLAPLPRCLLKLGKALPLVFRHRLNLGFSCPSAPTTAALPGGELHREGLSPTHGDALQFRLWNENYRAAIEASLKLGQTSLWASEASKKPVDEAEENEKKK